MKNKEQNKCNPFYWLGFIEERATTREFVILLVFGLGIYGFLHWKIPPSPPLSLKAKLARTVVLREITEQQKEINQELKKLSGVPIPLTPTPTETPSPSPGETPTETPTPETSYSPSQIPIQRTRLGTPISLILIQNTSDNPPDNQTNFISVKLTQETIEKWRTELELFFSDRPETQAPIEDNLNKLKLATKNFDELKEDDLREIEKILKSLENLLQGDELFWTDEKKWWEIIFWSLFGTLCYLIQQTTDYFIKTEYQKRIQGRRADTYLIRHKPKYYFFLLRSPFYTLIILFILSGASLDIVGISLSLATLGTPVLVALAFILGFANRVASAQLDMIIAAIFKDAWQRSVRKIDIYPSTVCIKCGTSYDFQVVPDVKVKWSLWSQPLVGTIDAATGMYIAPPKRGYIYDELGNLKKHNQDNLPVDQQVIIKAEREYEPMVSSLALVILINDGTKLIIQPRETIIKYPLEGEPQTIRFCIKLIKPSISGQQIPVEWTISPEGIGEFNKEKGEYTPPKEFPPLSNQPIELTVKAAMQDYPCTYAIAKVILEPPSTSETSEVSQTTPPTETPEATATTEIDRARSTPESDES